ncbi:hypothetical protein, partial [Streptomyces sp. NRRL B-24484]|uniref:hypothetical protein n=1 Tax=Streptomyces sp. NRRL B-24484 TaxID=1463833 RepID=UPI0013313A20
GKVGKAGIVAAMSAVAIGIVAPVASASNEANWTQGCRGYWYDTSGHAYCQKATGSGTYHTHYDCSFETDVYQTAIPGVGFSGTYSRYECVFSLDRTTVTYG